MTHTIICQNIDLSSWVTWYVTEYKLLRRIYIFCCCHTKCSDTQNSWEVSVTPSGLHEQLFPIARFLTLQKIGPWKFWMMEMESINGLVRGFPGFMLYSDLPSIWILVFLVILSNQQGAWSLQKDYNRSQSLAPYPSVTTMLLEGPRTVCTCRLAATLSLRIILHSSFTSLSTCHSTWHCVRHW